MTDRMGHFFLGLMVLAAMFLVMLGVLLVIETFLHLIGASGIGLIAWEGGC